MLRTAPLETMILKTNSIVEMCSLVIVLHSVSFCGIFSNGCIMLPGGACEACQARIMELGDVMAKLSDAEAELENRSQELTKLQQVCLFSHLL